MSRKYRSPVLDQDDFFSCGVLGFYDAILKYDENKKAAFDTYVRYRIKGAMLDEIRKMSFRSRGSYERGENMEMIPAENVPYEQDFGDPILEKHLKFAIKQLPNRNQSIIRERFYADKELKEIGKSAGLSESRVCNILRESFHKLRLIFQAAA